jgi:hypothetical protein
MGLASSPTANCQLGTTGTTALTCVIQGGPASVQGTVTLTRDATTGLWTCGAGTIPQKLIGPVGVCKGT